MAYATYTDVQKRMMRQMSEDEQSVCTNLLDDAAVIIDSTGTTATDDAKKVVSVRMVTRALGDGESGGVPIGASQGTMSGLGYSQSWTISSGSTGELYLGKLEKQLLKLGNRIGFHSVLEDMEGNNEGHDDPISC